MKPYPVRRTLPFALIALVSACGGRVIGEETIGADAGSKAPPGHPAPADASAPPTTSDDSSALEHSLPVGDCKTRPISASSPGDVNDILDGWLRAKIESCQVHGRTTCGDLTIHFSRMPVPSCADHLRFSERPAPEFVACMAKVLAAERCTAGNFVEGDAYTIALCP